MGNKFPLSLLLVSLVLLYHFFFHILLFLELDWINENEIHSLDHQSSLPLDIINPLPLPQHSGLHLLLLEPLEFLQDTVINILVAIINGVDSLVNIIPTPLLFSSRELSNSYLTSGRNFTTPLV
jgi:hypothetical protein